LVRALCKEVHFTDKTAIDRKRANTLPGSR